MELYDSIGKQYQNTRKPDSRISARLVALLNLPLNSTILDVGAGTGKYSRALADDGFNVLALEPSLVMQSQGIPHCKVRFIQAHAEKIPLAGNAADGAIIVLALHHFNDRVAAIREVLRVVGNGSVVILTFDPIAFEKFWLTEYFPRLGTKFASNKHDLSHVAAEIQSLTPRMVISEPFFLPRDLEDKFGAASWAYPEDYLKEEVRAGISDFAMMSDNDLGEGLDLLKSDIESSRWDQKYGSLRNLEYYDAGYKIIVVQAAR